jgi:RND family efflux transporter MFP subunit
MRRTIWFLGLLVCWLVTGCNQEQAQMPPPKPPVVLVGYPVVREVTDYEEVTGRAEAKPAVEIRPRVTGYLIKVHFKEGAIIKKGELLYEINPEPFKADLEKAEANLEQGKAKVEQCEADYKRANALGYKSAIAEADFDKAKADVKNARAAVKSYEAMRKMAKINLDYATIAAPFEGRVGRTMLDAGNLVKADETLLTTLVALDPMWVVFDVDERTWLRLLGLVRDKRIKSLDDARMPVSMGLADEKGFPHEGLIDFVENRLDPGTGTMRLWARFDNPKGTAITPGLFVRLLVKIGEPYQAILIPERALGTDQGQKFLYVVNDKSQVEYRKVKTGSLHNGLRVVESGLASGERVIVNGLQRVASGIVVEPKMTDLVARANGGQANGGKMVKGN